MTFRRTGVGKIAYFPRSDISTHAVLYNFDIDGHQLKPEHKLFLETQVAPILQQGGTSVVKGMCSRSGSRVHNNNLSMKRSLEVCDFLSRLSVAASNVFVPVGTGEGAAEEAGYEDGVEDEYYRAVEILLSPTQRRPELPKKKKRKPIRQGGASWKRARVWLDVDTIDVLVIKKIAGSFVVEEGFCNPYAWRLSVSSIGRSISAKGAPPIMPGDFRTTAADFFYDSMVFNPMTQWNDKTVNLELYGATVSLTIKNALPRTPGAEYQPLKGSGLKSVGRDVRLEVKSSSGEAGAFFGIGSIKNPRRVTPKYCA